MSHNTVKNLLERPENYNFEFECDVTDYIKLPSMERYIIYKATNKEMIEKMDNSAYSAGQTLVAEIQKNKEYLQLVDCDGCGGYGNISLIHDVYHKLWSWKRGDRTTFGNIEEDAFKGLFGGDTMNSVQTVLDDIAETVIFLKGNEYLLDKKSEEWNKYSLYKKDGKRQRGLGNFRLADFIGLYAECKKELLSALNVDSLSDYVDAYHTIGNFCLVPGGFNQYRGFTDKSIKDYWDRSLAYLKNNGWREDFNCGDPDFKDYFRYINYFFLWDYVDANGEYHPISLFQEGKNGLEDKTNFLKLVIRLIKRRGCFMVAMLRLQQELGESYNELRNSVFSKDDSVYGGYGDVFKVIIDELDKLLSKTEKQNMRSKLKNLLSEAEEQISEI